MNAQRIGGIVFLVTGVVLFFLGMSASNSAADRWTNFFTGHFTDATMWYLIGGGAAVVLGVLLVIFGRRMATT